MSQATPPTPALPADLERDMLAFADLSDEVLWAVARSTLSAAQQARLAELNELGQERPLTPPNKPNKKHWPRLTAVSSFAEGKRPCNSNNAATI